jgi:predicted anti-sigma-YlaC factor YlaD
MLSRGRFFEWLTQIYTTADSEIACEQAQTMLAAYVDSELAQTGVEGNLIGVRDHLAHCPDCRDEYTALHRVAELEVREALPAADEILAELGSGIAARPLTDRVPSI